MTWQKNGNMNKIFPQGRKHFFNGLKNATGSFYPGFSKQLTKRTDEAIINKIATAIMI